MECRYAESPGRSARSPARRRKWPRQALPTVKRHTSCHGWPRGACSVSASRRGNDEDQANSFCVGARTSCKWPSATTRSSVTTISSASKGMLKLIAPVLGATRRTTVCSRQSKPRTNWRSTVAKAGKRLASQLGGVCAPVSLRRRVSRKAPLGSVASSMPSTNQCSEARGNRARRGWEGDLDRIGVWQRATQRHDVAAGVQLDAQHAFVVTVRRQHGRFAGDERGLPAVVAAWHRHGDRCERMDMQLSRQLVFGRRDVGGDDFGAARYAGRRC